MATSTPATVSSFQTMGKRRDKEGAVSSCWKHFWATTHVSMVKGWSAGHTWPWGVVENTSIPDSLVSSNYQGFCCKEESGRPETGGEEQSLSQGHLHISNFWFHTFRKLDNSRIARGGGKWPRWYALRQWQDQPSDICFMGIDHMLGSSLKYRNILKNCIF